MEALNIGVNIGVNIGINIGINIGKGVTKHWCKHRCNCDKRDDLLIILLLPSSQEGPISSQQHQPSPSQSQNGKRCDDGMWNLI